MALVWASLWHFAKAYLYCCMYVTLLVNGLPRKLNWNIYSTDKINTRPRAKLNTRLAHTHGQCMRIMSSASSIIALSHAHEHSCWLCQCRQAGLRAACCLLPPARTLPRPQQVYYNNIIIVLRLTYPLTSTIILCVQWSKVHNADLVDYNITVALHCL